MVTHGPIFARFSIAPTNSDITLKIIQLFSPLISDQSLSANAFRMRCSSSMAFFVNTSVSLFFFFAIQVSLVSKYFSVLLNNLIISKSGYSTFALIFSTTISKYTTMKRKKGYSAVTVTLLIMLMASCGQQKDSSEQLTNT